ncbi:MAG TPA: ferric reductase-like transmembrane domain-containing protein [Candidatus Binatia bacterium]|nr:ferric reductase-like transmembrane domain-containing protein [Candidatus Binatia bacterium]
MTVHSLLSSTDPFFKWSLASAYSALAFLSAALFIGPSNILRNRPNPVSTDLRRDIGIWAALLGLFHTIVGLQVHMKGRFWLYFVFSPNEDRFLPVRYDLFGFANYTGLAATLVLIMLLALSNDLSLRRLGARRWKSLQRWNYPCCIFVVLHGVAYQFIENRSLWFIGLFGSIVLVAGALQLAGFRKKRLLKTREPRGASLAG